MLNLQNHSPRTVVCVNNTPKKLRYSCKNDYSDRLTIGKNYELWVLLTDGKSGRVYIRGDKPHIWYSASSFSEIYDLKEDN